MQNCDYNCEYKDECQKYIQLEQDKKDLRRKQLLGEKKNLLYYLKLLKYKKEVVRKPDCDSMCWVHLEIKRDKEKKHGRFV